jgi:hypothetical protein
VEFRHRQELGTKLNVKEVSLITNIPLSSVMILGLPYVGKDLGWYYVSLLFFLVFDLVSAINSLPKFVESIVREFYKQFSITNAFR